MGQRSSAFIICSKGNDGFSSADLVFGHTARGPLRLLKGKLLSDVTHIEHNILDYVSAFRQRLHNACETAQKTLLASQARMKQQYDKKAVIRTFEAGEQVLVLLPIPGSGLQARFSGPYAVERKLSDTDYVVDTPDRKRSSIGRRCPQHLPPPCLSL